MAARVASAGRISLFGWLRVTLRLTGIAILLAVCVPLYYLWPRPKDRNPWPRLFLKWLGRVAGLRVATRGAPVGHRAFLLANHVSWLDIPALAGATGAAFVAHQGLAGHPVLRRLCEMNRTVFIARDDRVSVASQVAQVREALRDTGVLAIFPEGTTGRGLLPFKSSLLSALNPVPEGIAVRPVFLDYSEPAEVAWVGQEPGLANALRILARRGRINVTVRALAPLEGAAVADRKAMAAAARAAIEQAMRESGGEPLSA